MHTILNGFDPGMIDGVDSAVVDDGRCVLLHAGSFYGHRSPTPLLLALQHLHRTWPDEAAKLLVVFLGLPSYDGQPLDELAGKYGVAGSVRVLPPVSGRQAMALLKGSNCALLFGQSGKESLASIPAKAFEYIGAGKPVLAIGAGQEACDVMARGGCRVWRDPGNRPRELASTVAQIVRLNGSGELPITAPAHLRSSFTQAHMAGRLEEILLAAAEASAAGNRPVDQGSEEGPAWR